MAYQPKSYRKFVATAATATLVASAIAPVAGAASNFTDVAPKYQDAVDYLVANNITKGATATTFGTHDNIKRGDLAIWLAAALKLDTTNAPASGFADTKGTRYDAAVSVLKAKGYINGKTATEFAPSATVTRGEMAIMLSNAYDLKSDVATKFSDAVGNYKTAIQGLYAYGVTTGKSDTMFGTSQNITRGDLAIFLKRAAEVVKTLEVKNVTATNAREITIEFNTAVDEYTASNAANYALKVAGATETNFEVVYDEDAPKQVVLKLTDLAKLANNEAIQLTVKKSVLNTELKGLEADYSKTWVFSDTVAPTISKVERDGNDIKVTFDDYVSGVELAKVGNADKTASVVVSSPTSKTITITGGATGLAAGNHSVLVSGVTDAAGNKSSVLTGTVVISADVVAPTVSKVEQLSDNTLKVTFNKEVTNPTFKVKKNGYDLSVSATPTGNAKEYTLTLADNGQVKVYETGATTSAVTLEVSGYKATSNNLYGTTYTSNVNLSKDATAPTVVTRFSQITDLDAGAGFNEVFEVRFNENLSQADASKLTLTDKDGVRQLIDSATIENDAAGNPTILRVTADSVRGTNDAVKLGSYTLNLGAGAVKDLAGNANAATTVSFTKSASSTDVDASASASSNVVTVTYTADMTTSATTLANYMLDGKALPAGTNIYFDTTTRVVKIELPAGYVSSTGGAVLTISDNVVSQAGSKVDAADRTQNITSGFVDNVKPELTGAKKVNETTVELTFSEAVLGNLADTNDFVVKVNGTTVGYTVADGTAGDNKVTLTLPTYNTAQSVTVNVTDTAADISLTDVAGNVLTKSTSVTAN